MTSKLRGRETQISLMSAGSCIVKSLLLIKPTTRYLHFPRAWLILSDYYSVLKMWFHLLIWSSKWVLLLVHGWHFLCEPVQTKYLSGECKWRWYINYLQRYYTIWKGKCRLDGTCWRKLHRSSHRDYTRGHSPPEIGRRWTAATAAPLSGHSV